MGPNQSKIQSTILKESYLEQLPEEILFYIFEYLDPNTLMKIGNTCTNFDRISNDPFIWKKLFKKENPHLSAIPVPPPSLKTWKKYYHHRSAWKNQWYKKPSKITTQIKYRKGVNKASFTTSNEFATCNWDRTIKLWSISKMKYTVLPTKPIGSVWSIKVNDSYSRLVSSSDNHEIHVYDLPSIRQSDELGVLHQEKFAKLSKRRKNTHKTILNQKKMYQQNRKNKRILGQFEKKEKKEENHESEEEKQKKGEKEETEEMVISAKILSGHTNSISCLKFDQKNVVSGSSDSTVRIWDQDTCKCKSVIEHTDSIWALDYLDDYLVSGSKDTAVRWWSIPREQMLDLLVGHTAPVSCIEYQNSEIVSGSYDSTVKIWDLRSFDRCTATLEGHRHPVSCLQLVDNLILSGSYDSSIKIWDKRKMNSEVHTFTDQNKCWILSLQYKDGRLLTSTNLGEVKIMDFRTKEMLEVETNELLTKWSSDEEYNY
ncbi:f-box/wd repeat-containing protein pof1 [Anaeramoeba flamelloides]|uniref:F-box/wd repeat-containing protein pof1 n=1 Tax=Anaeramoeba flamelloides TaxID=1746091 RepID=A0AAV7ZMS0_9EUKA|nr:f-box/wd repeat-containing protein pof1 [Anaeramoeba flamelloides]